MPRRGPAAAELRGSAAAASQAGPAAACPDLPRSGDRGPRRAADSWRSDKHAAQWLVSLENYVFPLIGDRLVDTVDGPAVRDVLARIWLAKPETARRIRQRIGVILDWSCAKGYRATELPKRSPSLTLPRQPKQKGHSEVVPFVDVPAFVADLRAGRPSMGRIALKFLILTAARSGEIREATWREIDRKAATWTVPAERMKAGVKHVVPLSGAALVVLDRVAEFRIPCTDLVFYGRAPKKPMSAQVVAEFGMADEQDHSTTPASATTSINRLNPVSVLWCRS